MYDLVLLQEWRHAKKFVPFVCMQCYITASGEEYRLTALHLWGNVSERQENTFLRVVGERAA